MPLTPEQFNAIATPGSNAQAGQDFSDPDVMRALDARAAAEAGLSAPQTGTTPPGTPPSGGGSQSQSLLNQFLSQDMVSSGDFEELIRQEQAATERVKGAQRELFAGARESRAEVGVKELGTGRALTSRAGGGTGVLPSGSVEATFLNQIEQQTFKDIADLTKQEAAAMANLDLESVRRIQGLRLNAMDRQQQIQDRKLQVAQFMFGAEQQQSRFESEQAQQNQQQQIANSFQAARMAFDLPEGQSIEVPGYGTITGMKLEEVEPFFKSSDIVGIMKELPQGQSTTITDPNTGEEYNIVGIGEAQKNTKTISSTNNRTGEVILTTYREDTGEIVNQVSAGNIGGRLQGTGGGVGRFTPTEQRLFERAGIVNPDAQAFFTATESEFQDHLIRLRAEGVFGPAQDFNNLSALSNEYDLWKAEEEGTGDLF